MICHFQEWGLDNYKTLHLGALDRGMCVAEAMMFFADINYVEAAQRVIAAKAEVGYTINIDIVPMLIRHKKSMYRYEASALEMKILYAGDVMASPNYLKGVKNIVNFVSSLISCRHMVRY